VLPELVLQAFDYEVISNVLTGMAVDESTFTPTDIEAYKDAAAKRGALTAMLNYYRNAFSSFQQQDWTLLDVPTLMIWGEEDAALGKELTYGTQKFVRDCQIRYIPNCSHWVQQERPELVNQYMREFLSRK
jgi:epoxide hydrolase 4